MPTQFKSTRRLFQHKIDCLLRDHATAGAAALDQCEADHARAVAYEKAMEQYRRAAGEIGADCVARLVTIAIAEHRPLAWVKRMVNEIVGKPAIKGTRVLFHWLLTENRPAWPSSAVPLALVRPEDVELRTWLDGLRADPPEWLLPSGVEQCFRDGYMDHEADGTERKFQAYIATAILQGQSDIEIADASREARADAATTIDAPKIRTGRPAIPEAIKTRLRELRSKGTEWKDAAATLDAETGTTRTVSAYRNMLRVRKTR